VVTKEKAVDELYSAIQRATAAIQPILILQEPAAPATPALDSAGMKKASDVIPVKDPEG
jgi:hypothetical protein